MISFEDFIAKLSKFAKQFINKNNVKETKVKIIWSLSFNNENNVIKVSENEKILRKFKKAKNFDELNAVVKEENNYKNTKYESNEKKFKIRVKKWKISLF